MTLCLGTVQFGMEYGIAQDVKPSCDKAVSILEFAFSNGITTFDTANAYGNAEDILGIFLKAHQNDRKKIHIITKIDSECLKNIPYLEYPVILEKRLADSLSRLQIDYVDTLLFHTSSVAFEYDKLFALYKLKKSGIIKHCGVSIYYPNEALAAIKSGFVDFIQLPFNLFDHRFYKENIFSLAKEKKVIIQTRSVFLQGLFAMDTKKLSLHMKKVIKPLTRLEQICQDNSLTKLEAAMGFVKSFPEIDKVVIGVNSLEQLKNNLQIYLKTISKELRQIFLSEFNNLDEDVYLPILWK